MVGIEFAILTATRLNFLNLIAELSIDELNKIPSNFNNNVGWHLGHLVVARQLLCYQFSGVETGLTDEMIIKYKKGSRPESSISLEEVNLLKELFISLDAKLEEDYKQGLFQNYSEYTTSYGVKISNIDDSIAFNIAHEGLHLGYVMALKRAVLH